MSEDRVRLFLTPHQDSAPAFQSRGLANAIEFPILRRRYVEGLMQAVKAAMDSGKYQGDVLYGAIELPEEFRNMRGYDRHIRRAAERMAYYYGMGW